MKKWSKIFLFCLPLTLAGTKLFGYPQNIAMGYTSCATCHHTPNGGDRSNAYGHLALGALIPDKSSLMAWMSGYRDHKEDSAATGYDEERKPQFHYELGGSLRSLLFYQHHIDGLAKDDFYWIPMLMEVQALGVIGQFSIHGAFNILSLKNSEGKRYLKPFSREHWLKYHWNHQWHIRVGRMTLPFGIRTADHTRVTRTVVNLGHSDQHYGLALDYITEVFSFHIMPFYGNFLKEKRNSRFKEEKGFTLSLKLAHPRRVSFGFSSLYKRNERNFDEFDNSLNTLLKLPFESYLLFEILHQVKFEEETKQKWASHLRVGKYLEEWVDIYGEYGEIRTENFKPYLTKVRVGLKGKIFPWLEVEPFVQYKLDKTELFEKFITPKLQKFTFALQVHAFY